MGYISPTLAVRNMKQMIQFYRDSLGFQMGMAFPDADNPEYADLSKDGMVIMLVLAQNVGIGAEEKLGTGVNLYMQIDGDIDEYYTELKNRLVMEAAGEEVTASNAAIAMNKLLQISAGAVYTDDGSTLEFDIKNRYSVLRETIDESSQKVLVFVPFKHTIDILVQKLRKDKYTVEVIRGDVPASKRTEIFKRFQEQPDPKILVIQPQSAAHGVTLTAANTVVWWGPTSSLETYAQANARVHRSGQRHPCTVVQLQGSAVEKHVYSLLNNRINVHSQIIDLYKQILD